MPFRVRLKANMAGDHGNHPAESIVTLPDHVARQVVLNLHGELVDQAGARVPHEFRADEAPTEPPAIVEPPAATAPAPTAPARGRKARVAVADAAEWTTDQPGE